MSADVCPACGYVIEPEEDGDGSHIDSECIENLQEQRDELLEALEGFVRRALAAISKAKGEKP